MIGINHFQDDYNREHHVNEKGFVTREYGNDEDHEDVAEHCLVDVHPLLSEGKRGRREQKVKVFPSRTTEWDDGQPQEGPSILTSERSGSLFFLSFIQDPEIFPRQEVFLKTANASSRDSRIFF